jgi:hypothetical protein
MESLTNYCDNLEVFRNWSSETSISPGEAVTQEVIDRYAHREALVKLTRLLATDGISWGDSDPAKISPESAKAAIIFLQRLRVDQALPKISPDGEGGVMLVWEEKGDPVVLEIQDWRMHLVTAAATPRAVYRNHLPFDGEQIPDEVSKAIPIR